VKEYWIQIFRRATWILFWLLFTLLVLAGGRLNWGQIDYPRLYGFCVILSAIVQAFSKPSQSQQGKPKYYIDIVAELLQGDRAAAQRLFNYTKDKFGGKTDDWVWQKVIRDIERDRR